MWGSACYPFQGFTWHQLQYLCVKTSTCMVSGLSPGIWKETKSHTTTMMTWSWMPHLRMQLMPSQKNSEFYYNFMKTGFWTFRYTLVKLVAEENCTWRHYILDLSHWKESVTCASIKLLNTWFKFAMPQPLCMWTSSHCLLKFIMTLKELYVLISLVEQRKRYFHSFHQCYTC